MSTIRFELRTCEPDENGCCRIRLAVQIGRDRSYYPTGEKCSPANWHSKAQKAVLAEKGVAKQYKDHALLSKSEMSDVNSRLGELKKLAADIIRKFEIDRVLIDTKLIVDTLRKEDAPKVKAQSAIGSIPAFIDRFIAESKATHKEGTLKAYFGLAVHLRDYEQAKRVSITFDRLDTATLRSFQSYLVEDRIVKREGRKVEIKGMNNTTCAKQISTLKTLINYARTIYKVKVNMDYKDFRVARKDSELEVIALTNDEFLTLFNLDLSQNSRLDRVRDVFCFACATGLRYSDLLQLKREHIGHSIKLTAAKTNQSLNIPLNAFSAAILDKYKGQHEPLPMISNQKLNAYIKELCKIAGIDTPIEITRKYGARKTSDTYPKCELVSIHTGRKTFTTLSLEKGIAPQDVMAITGHSTWKAFKRYVEVTNDRKQAVMAQAWGKATTLKIAK